MFDGANLTFCLMWNKTYRCLVRMTDLVSGLSVYCIQNAALTKIHIQNQQRANAATCKLHKIRFLVNIYVMR